MLDLAERVFFHQKRFVTDEAAPAEVQGDCWATAWALTLGKSESDRDALHFRVCAAGDGWFNVTVGWTLWMSDGVFTLNSVSDLVDLPEDADGDILVASGPSPRGDFEHSVLVDGDGSLLWDPHPSGDGLDGEPTAFYYLRRLLPE